VGIQPSVSTKPGGHSIIDEHQTRWAFNHRWASNQWAFNHRWALNWWHQQTDHSSSSYNTYDRVWVPFSHASAGVDQKIFISMANFENGHLAIWLMNLMKIRLGGRELDENQKMVNRGGSETWWKSDVGSRTWWKSVIRSSLGCKFRMHLLTGIKFFSSVWQIPKTVTLRWWIGGGGSGTWRKSDDLDQIIEKASTVGGFWEGITHIWAKFII
jgi:hypothetical protein